MGIYLNPGNTEFQRALNSEIYVDKSLLIEYTNRIINTNMQNICVSRPRRFGKSTDARMIAAYYDQSCDSSKLFKDLKIAKNKEYQKHLNKYNVILLNMQSFLSKTNNIEKMLELLTRLLVREIKMEYLKLDLFDETNLSLTLDDVYIQTKQSFIIIIDEWDCIFREYQGDKKAQEKYLDFLRDLLKDKPYVSLCYMTGILPIKKYGTHSALNMFKEVSMINPTPLEAFMGFTDKEVEELCKEYDIEYKEMKTWYDGYHLSKEVSVYNPRSVVYAIMDRKFSNYWTSTETYEALKIYIDMNYDGLKDDVIRLLSYERVAINPNKFQNDMTTFASKDDILTLLVHLGYLGYDNINKEVYIPNNEVISSFIDSIESSNWKETTRAILNSRALLEATINQDSEAVAKYIEEAHLETSILQYNDENALAYTIYLGYITARNEYTLIREMPSGKGYADIVFIPKKNKPAMIVELKWNHEAKTAIDQIKEKKYYCGLEKYLDDLLLVGISYNKETKEHSCIIERYR
ncbi:ATP-binding protein [[Clostridium] saccharogumia]|uniref:AAA family ATPase n=1 Tax=Thomasclavelia saccharogumia TaxID=341225 RepID=UPI001D065DA9|nr:AAA family ATPase [Thomasclavelia saccharogumia]MCB6707125.1 ATP-binding protein [Thomasclavelia saccharogumia]